MSGKAVAQVKVDDVMTHLVVTVRPDDPIEDVARKLIRNRISGAPVVRDGKLVGVISESDIVRALAPPTRKGALFPPNPLMLMMHGSPARHAGGIKAGEVMSTEVVSVTADTSVGVAASLIDRYGFRRVPVVDSEGYVLGILTRSDLVRALAHDGTGLRVLPPAPQGALG